jgi:hypothetical protein
MTDAKWWQKLTLPLARWANKLHAVLILFCKKKIMTTLGNQGVQTTRKDNKIIWNEGLNSDGQQFHHYI